MGVRGTLFAACLGVLLAVLVLRLQTDDAGAVARAPEWKGVTSDGEFATGDFYDGALSLNVRFPATRCTPDGSMRAGRIEDRWLQEEGGFRHDGRFSATYTAGGRTYVDEVTYEFDGGISGGYIVGHMTRVDSFAGRTCARESQFRLYKGPGA